MAFKASSHKNQAVPDSSSFLVSDPLMRGTRATLTTATTTRQIRDYAAFFLRRVARYRAPLLREFPFFQNISFSSLAASQNSGPIFPRRTHPASSCSENVKHLFTSVTTAIPEYRASSTFVSFSLAGLHRKPRLKILLPRKKFRSCKVADSMFARSAVQFTL